jgi:hypothetical protein
MFQNQRRGTAGLGSIGGVALVMVAWLISTGVLVKAYREGPVYRAPVGTSCELVCQATPALQVSPQKPM